MNKQKVVRWGGLLGALITGVSMIMAGDAVTGIGVISAAFGSAGVFQ